MKKKGQKIDRQDIITGHSKIFEKVVSQDGEASGPKGEALGARRR